MPPTAERLRGISPRTVAAFSVTLFLSLSMAFAVVFNRSQVNRLTMEQFVVAKGSQVSEAAARLLVKADMLSYHIAVSDGEIGDFGKIAAVLVDHPAILYVVVAPDGVVSDVYPREGNESVLGTDYISGGGEAVVARETRKLVLAGPFDTARDGRIVVGMLPVFVADGDGGERFWGIVSVSLRYQKLLESAGFHDLAVFGMEHEIWREKPDGGGPEIIADSGHKYKAGYHYVEKPFPMVNTVWYFRVLPIRPWYGLPETWLSVLVGLAVSLMVAALVQGNVKLNFLKDSLAKLSTTDPLTGVGNRRHFMDAVAPEMDRAARLGCMSFVIMLDLDHFKAVNDNHGHQKGDEVLKEVAGRVLSALRPYDLFARYGGEEFVIFVANMDTDSVMRLAERVRAGVSGRKIGHESDGITVTCSLGVAPATPENDLDRSIALADEALYRAKREGRDRVVMHGRRGSAG